MGYFSSGFFDQAVVQQSGGYPDLMAAAVGWLRATPAVVSAFGENTAALDTTKFWADEARRGVQLPWAVYEETDARTEYMTTVGSGTAYLDSSKIRFNVVAASKIESRQLGDLIASTLDDAPLVFDDGILMMFRHMNSFSPPVGDIGPGSPAVYVRVVVFDVMVQRSL